MSNTLTKDTSLELNGTFTPLYTPGSVGRPAYCIDVQVPTATGHYVVDPGDPVTGRLPGYFWVSTGTGYSTVHTCYPPVVGTPGTWTYEANYSLNYQLGWSGSAVSIDHLSGSGVFQFSVQRGVIGVVAGFNDNNLGSGYADIDHALYFHSSSVQVMERGVAKTASTSFATSDVWTIRRLGTRVAYYKNSTLFYNSLLPSSGDIFADASLFAGLDQIIDASLDATVDPSFAGNGSSNPTFGPAAANTVAGRLGSLRGFAANVTLSGWVDTDDGLPIFDSDGDGTVEPPFDADGDGDIDNDDQIIGGFDVPPISSTTGDWFGRQGGFLRSLVGVAYANGGGDYNAGSDAGGAAPDTTGPGAIDSTTGDWPGRAGGQLRVLVGEAYGGAGAGANYSTASGRLTTLTGGGDANIIIPEYTIVIGGLQNLAGFATALVGTTGQITAGNLTELEGFASNVAGGWLSRPNLGQLEGLAYDATAGAQSVMVGTTSHGVLLATGYSPQVLDSEGHPTTLGMRATGPSPVAIAYGGATLRKTKTAGTLSASATVTITGGVRATAVPGTLSASGTTTELMGMVGGWTKPYTAYARGGATAAVRGTVGTLSATGLVGRYGTVRVRGKPGTLVSTGTVGIVGSVVVTGPTLQVVGSGKMYARAAKPSFLGIGHVVVTVDYEAYSIALQKTDRGETTYTTRYATYPFDRIVRFGNTYYGVGATGLFALTGDLYDSGLIVADVVTAESDFGVPQLKRTVALWFGGRISNDFEVSVVDSEADTNTYKYRPVRADRADSHRCVLGKGIRARYLSFRIQNLKGNDFTVDDVTPEVALLRRTA